MNKSKIKYGAKLILSNILILFIGLIILEVIFGNWFNPNRLNRLNIIRNTTRVYDARDLFSAEDRTVIYKRDQFGFRGSYPSPDAIDILTIGGSTTDQRFVAEGKTWQDILAKKFRENGKSVNVVNAGVSGQSTYGHIKNFDWWYPLIPDLKAKYFLFYVGINDFYVLENDEYDDLIRGSTFRTMVKENSALYHLYRTIRGAFQAKRANLVHKVGRSRVKFSELEWTSSPSSQNYEEMMTEYLFAYKERLRILGKKVKELDGIPICVTQPARWYKEIDGNILGVTDPLHYDSPRKFDGVQINGVDYYHLMQFLNQATLDTCQEMGGIPIDLANEVDWEDEDFYDFHHNTPKGAEKIGLYLYEKLKDVF